MAVRESGHGRGFVSALLFSPLAMAEQSHCLRLIDFFKFYSRDFSYNTGVASIRAGLLKKDDKGWATEVCQAQHHRTRCFSPPFSNPITGPDGNETGCASRYAIFQHAVKQLAHTAV